MITIKSGRVFREGRNYNNIQIALYIQYIILYMCIQNRAWLLYYIVSRPWLDPVSV